MRLVLGKEITQIDQLAMEEYGITGLQLMENAGRAGAEAAMAMMTELQLDHKRDIAIFAGGGNNGGDGFVIARHLHNQGYRVRIFLLTKPEHLKGDALHNWQIVEKLKIPYTVIETLHHVKLAKVSLFHSVLILDALFGTGFHGQPNELATEVIQAINSSYKPVLAIDLPSGVNANTGEVAGAAVKATKTITFGWAKYGTRVLPAKALVGELQVVDITLPKALLTKVSSNLTELSCQEIKAWLPQRQLDSHKGSFGHVLVVGGSENMYGAPILASGGAIKSGAGLVTLASGEGVAIPLAARLPEVMNLPLTVAGGTLALKNLAKLATMARDKVLVLGMGAGRTAEVQELLHKLMQVETKGMVIDADGLFTLAKMPLSFAASSYPVVLTPHPKEMALLLDCSTKEVQENRLEAAEQAAAKFGAIVVLKGAGTLIAVPEKNEQKAAVYLNPTGNPGLATGGTGDVLAGIIGGFLAQGCDGASAAALGVYLHGLSGDLAKEELGEHGLTATDVLSYLPMAIKNSME